MTFKNLREREEGFTLIELLVVIIIIGILAAIAIPTFLNQRTKGWESAAQSTLRNAAIAQESQFTTSNTYTTTLADLEAEGFRVDATIIELDLNSATATAYCMDARHLSGGQTFVITSATGQVAAGEC